MIDGPTESIDREHTRDVIAQMKKYCTPEDPLPPRAGTITLQAWIAKLSKDVDPGDNLDQAADAAEAEAENLVRTVLMRDSDGVPPETAMNEVEVVQFNAMIENLMRLTNGVPRSVVIMALLLHLKNAVGPLSNYKRPPEAKPGRDWADAFMLMISKMGDWVIAVKSGAMPDK